MGTFQAEFLTNLAAVIVVSIGLLTTIVAYMRTPPRDRRRVLLILMWATGTLAALLLTVQQRT